LSANTKEKATGDAVNASKKIVGKTSIGDTVAMIPIEDIEEKKDKPAQSLPINNSKSSRLSSNSSDQP